MGKLPCDLIPVTAAQGEVASSREVAALEDRVAALEAMVQARDDFIAVAAHELRNPMTPIAGQVELLLGIARRAADPLPPKLLHGLERLERLIAGYVRRATTLLEVTQISAGRRPLRVEAVDLSAMVRSMASDLDGIAIVAGCRIDLAVEPEVIGRWDRMALEQILENLLSNALHYGAGAPIEIAVSVRDGRALLTVRDGGIGIAAEDQSRIFERFERAVVGGAGFGVGLWVTRQLVVAMQGEILLDSAPGEGSCFTVLLPLQAAGVNHG